MKPSTQSNTPVKTASMITEQSVPSASVAHSILRNVTVCRDSEVPTFVVMNKGMK